jgi:hypothetical protein
MKKSYLGFIISFFLVSLVFVQNAACRESMHGTVISIFRDGYFRYTGTGEWKRAVDGMSVRMGCVLATGSEGKMTIEFKKGNLFCMGPNTVLCLTDFSGDKRGGIFDFWTNTSVIVDLYRGTIYCSVKKHDAEDSFQVRHKLSILETPGGEFSVTVRADALASTDPSVIAFMERTAGKKEVPGGYAAVGGKMSTVVTEGSVSLMSLSSRGKPTAPPAVVTEGNTSEVDFMYLRRHVR